MVFASGTGLSITGNTFQYSGGGTALLITMNGPSLDKFESMLVPGGDLFINSSIISQKVTRDDINVHYVDCQALAEQEVGSAKTQNMVMLGAIIQVTNVVKMDTMADVFAYKFTGGKAKLIPQNIKALEVWKPGK